MAGLLDFLSTPSGIGLLSAVAGGMAGARRGTPINNIGRGVATGLTGYQGAMEAQRLELEKQRKKQAMMDVFANAMNPGKPAIAAQYGVGNTQGDEDYARMAIGQNRDINALSAMPDMSRLPKVGNAQTIPLPLNKPIRGTPIGDGLMAVQPDYENDMITQIETGAMEPPLFPPQPQINPAIPQEMLPEQAIQLRAAQEAQAGGLDRNKLLMNMMQNPDAGFQDVALKAYLDQKDNPSEKFGKIMPHSYTPASLARYQQSGNYADLEPIGGGGDFGKVNPGQFTPDSLARYAESGQWGDLVPFRSPTQIDRGDRKDLYDPGTGRIRTFSVAPPPEQMPTFKAAQATATAQATADVANGVDTTKKVKSADTLISYIGRAEDILKRGDATGSMVGAGIAAGKSAFGISDKSTQDNQQLELISGWMVSNVPRMEGPQSNYDIQNYQTMAAVVGDKTKPRADRLAALRELRGLQEKYKEVQTGAPTKRGGTLSQGEILNEELRNASASGDTRNANLIREEMRRMGIKEAGSQASPKPAATFDLPPNAKQYEGKVLRDTKSGKRFKSVGGKWQEVK